MLKDLNIAIQGAGRIDESKPIVLEGFANGYSSSDKIPIVPVPRKICFSKKLGTVTYDVTGTFDDAGTQTLLQQMKEMLLRYELQI